MGGGGGGIQSEIDSIKLASCFKTLSIASRIRSTLKRKAGGRENRKEAKKGGRGYGLKGGRGIVG